MDYATATSKIIGKSFISVFESINISTESWYQQKKLLTIGKGNYVQYIEESVGKFPLFGTQHFASVDQSYINVCTTSNLERERYQAPEEIEKKLRNLEEFNQDSRDFAKLLLTEAIESFGNCIALLGNPGSGKTTEFRHLAIYAAKGNKIRNKVRIPIYIPLRDLEEEKNVLDFAQKAIRKYGVKEFKKVTEDLLKNGRILLLIDGLDEVSSKHQRSIIKELQDLRSSYRNCVYCVSGRPLSLSVGMPGFHKFQTIDLSRQQQFAFVKKWFSVVDDKRENLSKLLLSDPSLLDIGKTPLILSLLCALYNNDLNIPRDIEELYSRCVEGLLGQWDSFRNIIRKSALSGFSITKRLFIVHSLAAALMSNGLIVFRREDLDRLDIVKNIEDYLRDKLPESHDILSSLCEDFGILIERAPGLYSFSHLTLQEYLTAKHVVDQRFERNLLSQFGRNSLWDNVLFLTAKMLPRCDEYIRQLAMLCKPDSIRDIALLTKVLNSKPIFSDSTEREILNEVFVLLTSMTKIPMVDYEIRGNTLYIVHSSLSKKSDSMWMVSNFTANGVELIEVVRSNQTILSELSKGVNQRFISTLRDNGFPKIETIKQLIISDTDLNDRLGRHKQHRKKKPYKGRNFRQSARYHFYDEI